MARLNNNRKFPEGTTPRPDLSDIKRSEAQERQAHYDTLSVAQKLEALDKKFGVGMGASKQRARYAALNNGKNAPVVVENVVGVSAVEQEQSGKKRLKAKDRRKMEMNEEEEYEDQA